VGRCKRSGHGDCDAVSEENGELGLCHVPLARGHDPLLPVTIQDQEEQFVAASSLGKWLLALTARRSLAFSASMVLTTGMKIAVPTRSAEVS
jgi:hypothetical protein